MAITLPTTSEQYGKYTAAQDKYRKQQTGGASFLAALQTALAGADSQNTALRSQEQTLVQQQFTEPTKYREELIGQGITDPYKRQALLSERQGGTAANLQGVRGKLQDLGGQREQVLGTAGKAYDAETQAALQEANSAGDFFKQLLGNDQSREQMLAQQKFQSRNDDLERRQMEAAIASANRANRGSPTASPWDLVEDKETGKMYWANKVTQETKPFNGTTPTSFDPIAALTAAGGRREAGQNGGFNFFGAGNKPITAEEAAKMVPGSSLGDFLSGSTNKQDAQFANGNPSDALGQAFNSAIIDLPAQRATGAKKTFNELLAKGNTKGAAEFVLRTARSGASTEQKGQVYGRDQRSAQLEGIKKDLAELNRLGGKTGVDIKIKEGVAQLVGRTTNPELAKIQNRINSTIQQYTRAISGAAFTDQEYKRYQNVFPNTGKVTNLNEALIDSLIDASNLDQEIFYRGQLGSAYDAVAPYVSKSDNTTTSNNKTTSGKTSSGLTYTVTPN